LRVLKRYDQAVAIMQVAAVKAPTDFEVLGAYGKALADSGQLEQAAKVLANSYTPDAPNWSNLSTQGYIADRLGDHQTAQRFYQSALKIAPHEASVLNNLGLSYALDKQLREAEQTLREADAQPSADERVRANLALVLSLEGKFDEAERVSQHDMPRAAAVADATAVRGMMAQTNSWRQIESSDAKRLKAQKADVAQRQPAG
jgi:Flp pilus assembly protein TadD